MSVLLDVIRQSTKLSDKTKADYERYVQRFIDFAGADPLAWNGAVVEAWRDRVSHQVGASTVNKHLYALRYASKRLEGLGIGRDFARAAETLPSPRERRRRALTYEQAQAILATCDAERPADIRDRAAIILALKSGLRRENFTGPRGMQFSDLDGRSLHCIIKGGKRHIVALDDQSLESLAHWTRTLEAAAVLPRGPIFRRVSRMTLKGDYLIGPPISRLEWFNRMVARRARAAGVRRRVHPHLFRHTFVTWALERGVPPHRVMLMTGQADMATLSQYASDLHAADDPVGSYLPEL